MLWNGLGTKRNPEKALSWFAKSAELEDAFSEYMLGISFLNGYCNYKKDLKEAKSWLRRAALHGYNDAQMELEKKANWINEQG